MNHSFDYRQLPSVDEVLRDSRLADVLQRCGRSSVADWTREAIQACRADLQGAGSGDLNASGSGANRNSAKSHWLDAVIEQVTQSARRGQSRTMRPVINATGVLLHTNLGRAPLADEAVQRMLGATRYCNLESDLASGKRNQRGSYAASLLSQLTGAEDAVVVNNCAAATMLVLQAIAGGREVIVSRGQLVEIGGGFRLPEVFESAGVRLVEVGTTNRTYVSDYQRAMTEQTGAIIRVHRSNFTLTGFVAEPTLSELIGMERPANLPIIDDAGSGCVVDLASFGINEPTVQRSVQAGADLCLFSADKLFGGPQAGIIVGRQAWVERLRKSPLMRAMRPDKLTFAALEATAELHLREQSFERIPFYQMLNQSQADLLDASSALHAEVSARLQSECELAHARVAELELQVVECESQIGGGSLPGTTLPSAGLGIQVPGVDRLATLLRCGGVAVQARIADERLLLDLRTVLPVERAELGTQIVDALLRLAREDGTPSLLGETR